MQAFFEEFPNDSGVLRVDLKAIAANYRLFQDKVVAHCTVAGVVKANAYGVGMAQIAKTLLAQGCAQFFVATLDEAVRLRDIAPNTPIAVLGGLFKGAEGTYTAHNITPVLNSPDDITRWGAHAQKQGTTLPAIIHVDTAMNRLGLSAAQAHALTQDLSRLDGIDVQIIMSHFACADEAEHSLTAAQATRFAEISKYFPQAKKSLANSSGLFRAADYHYDMVRPGYSLYGGNPTPEGANPMQAVVHLQARILQIRDCRAGESIGYGASHIFTQDTRTATIALGYADGFLRSNSQRDEGGACVYWHGHPCSVLGRVSMDLVSIDLSNLPKDTPAPQIGEGVEILGPHQSVDDLAKSAGTIGYEILTSLGARYRRIYSE